MMEAKGEITTWIYLSFSYTVQDQEVTQQR